MLPRPAISVLLACAGHQCCSPAALAIARSLIADRDLRWLHIDAAGTEPSRRGDPPHPLSAAEGARRGYSVDHRLRPVHPDDFAQIDLIVAMNQSTIDDLRRLGGSGDQRTGPYVAVEPHQAQLLRRWDPYGMPGDEDVGDPCGGGGPAFAEMFDILERSIPPMIDHLTWLAEDVLRQSP